MSPMDNHKVFPIKLPCVMFFTKEDDEYSEISEETESEEEEEEYYGENVDDGDNDGDDDSNGDDEDDDENDHDDNGVVEEEHDEEDENIDEKDFKYKAFYSAIDKESYKEEVEHKINPKRCWVSSQGWLLIYEYETSNCFLLNPISRQQVQLPSLELEESTENCKFVLSSSPISSYCRVVFADFDGKRLLFCKLAPSNDSKWVSYDYSDQFDETDELADGLADVTFSNGQFYGLAHQSHILTIDTDPHPLITFIKMERIYEPNPFQYHHFYSSFLDSCGELYHVWRILTNGSSKLASVCVYKADLIKRKWNKVSSIGDRSFLMDAHRFSVSYSSKEMGLKSDCIYFIGPRSTCMGIYNIKDGSVKTEVSFPRSYFPPFWILPPI